MAQLLIEVDVDLTREPEAVPARHHTPFTLAAGYEPRPLVRARVDGVELSMHVHANAGMLAMITHDAAYRVSGRRIEKEQEFGLGPDLRVSADGRGHLDVASLDVAGHLFPHPRLDVFNLVTNPWDGMLGLGWLHQVGAIVDFGARGVYVPEHAGEAERIVGALAADRTLVRLPLLRHAGTGRYRAQLSTGSPGTAPATFVVSTVAFCVLDSEHARRNRIPAGASGETEHGPSGTSVATHHAASPVALRAGDIGLGTTVPEIYDIYAYADVPRPADPAEQVAGYVGADYLLQHRAVLDFGDVGSYRI
ncbi:MAG: hypothetical protein ACRDP1_01740 [Nocardioidaceae bacterium]